MFIAAESTLKNFKINVFILGARELVPIIAFLYMFRTTQNPLKSLNIPNENDFRYCMTGRKIMDIIGFEMKNLII